MVTNNKSKTQKVMGIPNAYLKWIIEIRPYNKWRSPTKGRMRTTCFLPDTLCREPCQQIARKKFKKVCLTVNTTVQRKFAECCNKKANFPFFSSLWRHRHREVEFVSENPKTLCMIAVCVVTSSLTQSSTNRHQFVSQATRMSLQRVAAVGKSVSTRATGDFLRPSPRESDTWREFWVTHWR